MGVLMLRCPTTGRGFATGVLTDDATFKRMPDTTSTARCPHCGQEHPWRPNDMHGYWKPSRPFCGWKM
jgi:hypothetical protein